MQVAIITGAGSGIGLATAKQLYDMGMAIVGVGRDPAKLTNLEAEIDDPDRLATLSVDIATDAAHVGSDVAKARTDVATDAAHVATDIALAHNDIANVVSTSPTTLLRP